MTRGFWLPLLPFLVSCAQVSGFDDLNFTEADTDNKSCGFTESYPPCQDCFNTYCCDEGQQCINNQACTSLLACMADCNADDSECAALCLSSYPNGYTDLIAVLDCRNDLCGPECNGTGNDTDTGTSVTDPPGTDAVIACGGMSWIPETCQTCYETWCCATGTACAANENCVSLLGCIFECPTNDNSCYQSCYATYPSGGSDFEAMQSCMATHCTDLC